MTVEANVAYGLKHERTLDKAHAMNSFTAISLNRSGDQRLRRTASSALKFINLAAFISLAYRNSS